MTEIVRGLSKGTGKDDPVVYFYEDFLREYDKKISEMRGVYYTPMPVVSYIVSSITYLLKNRFNRPQGLADENTYILDPATGTGTFLYAVINEIYESMSKQGQMGKWDGYVAKHLLPRIFGFELLMAPYVIAHLKLGLQLRNTGYTFQSKERLGVYLTNTLEEAVKSSEMLMAQYIVKEANAAAEIKKEKPIMVVLGNPPYSGASANKGKWITNLINGVFDKDGSEIIRGYKMVDNEPLGERNPKWLQDDYVKFIRFGQWRIERTEQGIMGFITNHAYLDNPTFRGMRQSLMQTFSDIYLLDLHGSVLKREGIPNGCVDENVFDIQQGVAIGLFVKELGKTGMAKVHHADLWGQRGNWPDPQPGTKYHTLLNKDIASTEWTTLQPHSPYYFFVPSHEEVLKEYEQGHSVTDVFPIYSVGILTHRDNFAVDLNMVTLRQRIKEFRESTLTNDEVHNNLNLGDWDSVTARMKLRKDEQWGTRFQHYLYRPFDIRSVYYSENIIDRPRPEVMRHMLHKNMALITQRQTYGWPFRHVFVANMLSDLNVVSNLGGGSVFPLYLYPVEEKEQPDKSGGKEGGVQPSLQTQVKREPNLNPEFIKAVSDKLGLKFVADGKGDLKDTWGPEDVFNYAYAVFHSPSYRSRYAELLKIDFPRLPLTSDLTLFRALYEKGEELVSWHLLTNPSLQIMRSQIKHDIKGSNAVEKVRYDDNLQRVYINKAQYFEGIAPDVWNFHIGGYQVCQKWLKDRKGRTLTYDELTHYQKVIVALKETIRLMDEIDELIPGWPIE